MIRFACLVVGLALMGYVTLSWLDPQRQPAGIVGLNPEFRQIDELYDAALANAQPDEALAWVDEYLLSAGGGSPEAQRAWALRDAARLQGATFSGYPVDRGQRWRLERVLSRRPAWEKALGLLGSVLFWAGVLALMFYRAPREEDRPIQPPPEHIDRVYG